MLEPLPEFPWALEYLWEYFWRFAVGLKTDGMAPVQAGWLEIQAWCAVARVDLDPWEKETLVRLANLRAQIESEAEAQKREANSHRGR